MGVFRRKVPNAEGQRHWATINLMYGNIRGLRGAGHQTVVELGWDDVGIVAQRAAAGSIGGVRLLCRVGPVLNWLNVGKLLLVPKAAFDELEHMAQRGTIYNFFDAPGMDNRLMQQGILIG